MDKRKQDIAILFLFALSSIRLKKESAVVRQWLYCPSMEFWNIWLSIGRYCTRKVVSGS